MTDTAQLATLLDRSPAASVSGPEMRAAIEIAVAELVSALRNHHTGTADHSNRLAVDCRCVAEELELGADVVFEVELVAILHDIGKLAVPAAILDLRAAAEQPRARGGPGAHDPRCRDPGRDRRAAASRAARAREPRALGRHRLPGRLTGDQIPLAARIVFTVDAYDAMTNDRAYRRALDRDEARRRISAGAGTAFDPRVVRAMLVAL